MAETVVNKRELARLMGCSEPTVDRMIDDGCPVRKRGSNGIGYEFVAEDVLAWRRSQEELAQAEVEERAASLRQFEMQLTGGTLAEGETAKLSAKDRILALDAERRALILKREKGETLDRDEAARDYQAVFGLLQQRLMGMATVLTRSLALTPDQRRIVDGEVRGLLVELSKQIADPAMRPALADASAPELEAA